MPHRDPETGQFVADGSHELGGLDDIEVQLVESRYEVDASDLPYGDSDDEFAENVRSVQPAGGLARGEVAELVAARFHVQPGTKGTQTAEGGTSGGFELSSDPDSKIIASPGTKAGGGNIVTSISGNQVIDAGWWDSTDPDLLWWTYVTAEGSHRDTASGTGGGADRQQVMELVPFRSLFGMGPTFDRRDELHEHIDMDTLGVVDDVGIELDVQYALYWNVFDE